MPGRVFESVAGLRGIDGRPLVDPRLASVIDGIASALEQILAALDASTRTSNFQLDMKEVRAALESKGSHPLNVTALRGQLSEPQVASAPTVSSLPSLNDTQYEDGALIAYNGVVYRRNRTSDPGTWDPITNVGSVSSFSASPTSIFDVANPTTTPALSLDNQAANIVLAGPSSGGAATPSFRALVVNDLPQAAVKSTNSKETAGAPYTNDGRIEVTINGVAVKLMTTA